ncbi:MAG TPA: VWA domain-containing protein [Rhodoblastus sp.]|nr:VWA domain-containing protein [Rhodoblastus sp.]
MTGPATRFETGGADDVARRASLKLAAFLNVLRGNSFHVGLQESCDAAAAMSSHLAAQPELLRSAFKHIFASRKSEWERFDGVFDAFWRGRGVRSRSRVHGAPPAAANPSLKTMMDGGEKSDAAAATDQTVDDGEAREGSSAGRMEGASRAENLADIDFRKMSSPEQAAEAHAAAAQLARAMRTRLTRRHRARRRGRRLDLRRTIHANVSHGGAPIRLVKRIRRDRPLRLVVLLDASGSMSMYTGLFIRFVHGVLDEFREAEAFLFHTRLAYVSDAMKERDAARALDRLAILAQGVGGGTRIGECLHTFNRQYAARVVNSRTCAMIVSDGYETGDPELLGREMASLARRCRRIVWLNPMMGWEGYAPEAAGLRAALPHIDLLAPAHNLRSLAALEPYLARL